MAQTTIFMTMTLETKLKLQNILLIMGITLIFGVLYNFFFYPHTVTEFLEASIISLLMGLIIGVLEEFTLKIFFQKMKYRIFLQCLDLNIVELQKVWILCFRNDGTCCSRPIEFFCSSGWHFLHMFWSMSQILCFGVWLQRWRRL